jgi:hypothetical protein
MLLQDQLFLLLLLICLHFGYCAVGGGDVLDSYGNAVALQHAASAADVQGRSRIVLTLPSSTIWILSPMVDATPKHRFLSSRASNTPSLSQYRIAPSSFLVATGVAPDVIWLRQQLRLYYKHVQERYIPNKEGDISSNKNSVFSVVTSLMLRQFWEDPNETATWMPVGYQLFLQEMGEDRPSWGRPLGLRCLLIQWNGRQFCLDEFDPSGTVVRTSQDENDNVIQVFCMGPKSEVFRDELMKLYTQLQEASSRKEKLEDLLVQALRPHGPSWQLEILTVVDGAVSLDQQVLSTPK